MMFRNTSSLKLLDQQENFSGHRTVRLRVVGVGSVAAVGDMPCISKMLSPEVPTMVPSLRKKGADIGAHKFAAHGYDLPQFAGKTAIFSVSSPIRDRRKALTCRGLRDAIAIEKGAYADA